MTNLIGRVKINGTEKFVTPNQDNKEELIEITGDFENGFIKKNRLLSVTKLLF